MSETMLIWLFGLLGGWCLGNTVFVFKVWTALNDLRYNSDLFRITLTSISKKAAEMLHSPDDHLNMDTMIEMYSRNDGKLTLEEWQRFHKKCEFVSGNPEASKVERFLAEVASKLSDDKLPKLKK